MKQHKTVAAIAVLGLAFAASAARADSFDGFYVGGGLNMIKGSAKITATATTTPGGALLETSTATAGSDGDKHQIGLNLSGGYGKAFGQFHIAGELAYANTFGKTSTTDSGPGFGSVESTKVTNVWSLSVLPGFKLGEQSLAFVRLGYAQAKASFNESVTPATLTNNFSQSNTHNGLLYGIGMKQAFSRNLALVLEYQNLDLKDKTFVEAQGTQNTTRTFKPGGAGFVLGVQYGF